MMKAQAISTDFMFAIIIVLLIITAFGVILTQLTDENTSFKTDRDMDLRAQATVDVLVNTPGNPSNWTDTWP
jgi:hypothetical protein